MENYRMFLTKSIVYTYIFLIQYVLFSFLKLNSAETEGGGGENGFETSCRVRLRLAHSVAIKFCLFGGGYK